MTKKEIFQQDNCERRKEYWIYKQYCRIIRKVQQSLLNADKVIYCNLSSFFYFSLFIYFVFFQVF